MPCKYYFAGICDLTYRECIELLANIKQEACPSYEEDNYMENPNHERDLQE